MKIFFIEINLRFPLLLSFGPGLISKIETTKKDFQELIGDF